MYISTEDWKKYIEKLSAIDKEAARLVQEWVQKNGFGDREALIDYVNAVITTYSEASGALAAQMYDATCEMEGAFFEPAEMAPVPEYGEVAKAVNGVLKHSENPGSVANIASRLVKRTGADTMLKNAERDGAEFAWIPNGDTCAFCIALASRGWQRISKKALKNGHAEHIHGHCDCTYAIRHSKDTNVEGYDPDKYLEMYENASDGSPKDKINAMRRELREQNKNKINAQKREAYSEAKRQKNRFRGDERVLTNQLSFNYNGSPEFIPLDTIITEPYAMAGNGTNKEIRDVPRLVAVYDKEASEWKKMSGKIKSDKYLFDIHWYECDDGIVREPKIKNMKELKK